MLCNVVNVLVASARKCCKDRTARRCVFLCVSHSKSNCVRAFKCGDNSLITGKGKECLYSLFVVNRYILYTAAVVQICVLGTDRRIVKTAGDRVSGNSHKHHGKAMELPSDKL